ncbi:restriction endonuclease subunit S [Methylocystis rosea]|uniref:restriction endonuclease subunit S n=1 Tax=Methylocystis rosea TaxID=173366 RepID=UPI001FDF0299|nr:restriction endonuclease subunit S [Methylocystis rosea]
MDTAEKTLSTAPLAECCEIQTGYTARARLEPAPEGVRVVQLRDIGAEGEIDIEKLERVTISDPADRYLVAAGDVVFRSRGDRNIAIALETGFAEPAIAISPLFVLRPNPGVITADYLAWSLNQPEAQRQIDAIACGTGIRMVPKAGLDALHIAVPDLETQRRMMAIDRLAARERRLLLALAEKRRALTNLVLSACAHRAGQSNIERNAR